MRITQGDEIANVSEPALSEGEADRAMEQKLEAWLAKKCPPVPTAEEPPAVVTPTEIATPDSPPPSQPIPATLDGLITVNQAAGLARVSRRTIYLWVQQGKLRTKRTVGGGLRIDRQSLFHDAPIDSKG